MCLLCEEELKNVNPSPSIMAFYLLLATKEPNDEHFNKLLSKSHYSAFSLGMIASNMERERKDCGIKSIVDLTEEEVKEEQAIFYKWLVRK